MSFQVQLPNCPGINALDSSGMIWTDVVFEPHAITNDMLITVLTVYTSGSNGFTAIELYATGRLLPVYCFPKHDGVEIIVMKNI